MKTLLDGVLIRDDRSLADTQAEALERVSGAFDLAVDAGMPWAGKVVQIDDEARANMTSMVLAAQLGLLPRDFAWRMADNTFLPMDGVGMQAMAGAALGYYLGLRRRLWAVRDAIRATTTRDEADAVQFDPSP